MAATRTLRPIYLLAALGLPADFDAVTAADVKKAYASLASNGLHPDHGGDAELWTLITAAYNELKAIYGKKRGQYESSSDKRWLASWDALHAPKREAKADAPKAKRTKVNDGFVFEDIEGESKEDRRKRYARQRQQYRYQQNPEFAEARRQASKKSHAKAREAKKAAKEAASA